MKKLRIGVIGLGDICDVYLKTLLANNDKVSVEACASRGLGKGTEGRSPLWDPQGIRKRRAADRRPGNRYAAQ